MGIDEEIPEAVGRAFDPGDIALAKAALDLAGPKATDIQVERAMIRIAKVASGQGMKRTRRYASAVTFKAVVDGVSEEENTGRGLVRLRVTPSAYAKAKHDQDYAIQEFRTDHLNTWLGAEIFAHAKDWAGRGVFATKGWESAPGTPKGYVRVLIDLVGVGQKSGESGDAASTGAEGGRATAGTAPRRAPDPPATPSEDDGSWAGMETAPSKPSPIRAQPQPDSLPAPARAVTADEIRHGFAEPRREAAGESALPEVKIPKGQVPGDKPNQGQLSAIAQHLEALGFDQVSGRNYALGLLGIVGESLNEIPTWYEAAQLVTVLGQQRAEHVKGRRPV